MGDLDNFFAKKDKKKAKGLKYSSLDDIGNRLKESEKKLEKELCKIEPVKKTLDEVLSTATTNKNDSTIPEQRHEKEEEEWKDFTDEAQKDLSNLKISRLQIEDDEDGTGFYGSGEDDGNLGDDVSGTGVWNKNISVRNEQEALAPEPEISVPSKGDQKSSYVPPHLRNAAPSPLPKVGSRKPKTAPDITNAMAFPSLSDAQTASPAGPWGRKKGEDMRGFDSVKHGASRLYVSDRDPPKLSTANRFDALADNS